VLLKIDHKIPQIQGNENMLFLHGGTKSEIEKPKHQSTFAPARFHQFFHLLRATYLRAACGVPANPLASSLAEKELGPHNIPIIQCPIKVSLQADAFAISKLREYRGGSIIQWAWVSTGHITEEELANWRHGGDKGALEQHMAVARGGFKELLQMTEAPEVDHSVGGWKNSFFGSFDPLYIIIYIYRHLICVPVQRCEELFYLLYPSVISNVYIAHKESELIIHKEFVA